MSKKPFKNAIKYVLNRVDLYEFCND